MENEPGTVPGTGISTALPVPADGTSADPSGGRKADLYLTLGRILYESGSTVQRVHDSVLACARTLGDRDVHVFVEYNAIEISRREGNDTQLRLHVFSTPPKADISVLQKVSRMLESATRAGCTLEALESRLKAIEDRRPAYHPLLVVLAVGIACAGFAYLNRADPASLWVVLAAASAGMAVRLFAAPRSPNFYLTVLVSALTAAFIASLLLPLSSTTTSEVTLIASVLFLVPLLILINGGLDIIRDYTGCGLARVTSFVMQCLVISTALLVPLSFLSPGISPPFAGSEMPMAILASTIVAGIGSVGFAIMMNMPRTALLACFFCGGIARGIRETAILAGFDPLPSIFCGMVAGTLLAFYFSDRTRVPEVAIAITAALPMSPGISTIRGLEGLYLLAQPGMHATFDLVQATFQNCLYAAGVSFALVAGIILPLFLRFGRLRI